MKIKFTKTIPLDDLPGETRRIIDVIKNKIVYALADRASQVARSSLSTDGQEYFSTIQLIDLLRQDLASIDSELQEVNNILIGHRDTLTPPENKEDSDVEEENKAHVEDAEYEKHMSRVIDSEEGFYEEG